LSLTGVSYSDLCINNGAGKRAIQYAILSVQYGKTTTNCGTSAEAGSARQCQYTDITLTESTGSILCVSSGRRTDRLRRASSADVGYEIPVNSEAAANTVSAAITAKNKATGNSGWTSTLKTSFHAHGASTLANNLQTVKGNDPTVVKPLTPTPTPTNNTNSTNNTSSSSSSGLSAGAIAGIVIACVVAAIVIIGVVYFMTSKREPKAMDGTTFVGSGHDGPTQDDAMHVHQDVPPTMGENYDGGARGNSATSARYVDDRATPQI
jgi:hypothetical protein